MAQIAGRAGRASRDGTFGTTGRCPAFDQELVERLESHNFEPVRVMQWRNAKLDFRSLGKLIESLAETPREEGLTRAPIAEDALVLERLAKEDDIAALAKTPDAVERLWEVCQIPDYRKIAPAAHAELVTTLYGFLMREGRIAPDWMARQVAQTDRTDGDIDTLSNRIAQVRTWTFAANRPDWLDDPGHWQGVARGVEDKLSDALHERLTQRFVDRRTSVLMRRLRENAILETEITKTATWSSRAMSSVIYPASNSPRRILRASRMRKPCGERRKRCWRAKSKRARSGLRRLPTSSSCSPPTAPSAGPASRSRA